MKRLSEYINVVHSQHETQEKCILRSISNSLNSGSGIFFKENILSSDLIQIQIAEMTFKQEIEIIYDLQFFL